MSEFVTIRVADLTAGMVALIERTHKQPTACRVDRVKKRDRYGFDVLATDLRDGVSFWRSGYHELSNIVVRIDSLEGGR